MTTAQLGIEVDTTKIEIATAALHQLAEAAAMARGALQALGFTLSVEMMVEGDAEPVDPEDMPEFN